MYHINNSEQKTFKTELTDLETASSFTAQSETQTEDLTVSFLSNLEF